MTPETTDQLRERLWRRIKQLRDDFRRTSRELAFAEEEYARETGSFPPGSARLNSSGRPVEAVAQILAATNREMSFLEIKGKLMESAIAFSERALKTSLKTAVVRGQRIIWTNRPPKLRIIQDDDRFRLND